MLLVISLLVCGIFLILLEIFIPGGVLGAVGVILVIIGLVVSFSEFGTTVGAILTISAVVLGGLAFWAWLKWFPDSRMGKKIMLAKTADTWRGYDEGKAALIGRRGEAKTDLRPAGVVMFDRKRTDVITRGELINRGAAVVVTAVEGNRVVVQLAPADEPNPGHADSPAADDTAQAN